MERTESFTMNHGYYILNAAGEPIKEPDLTKWAVWFQLSARRRVADETINDSRISTVFLGLDHSFEGPPPILWETMVFGGPLNEEQDRCSGNREQAEAMHAKMVERVKAAHQPNPKGTTD
jgi:hypothetical protein